MYDRSTNSHFKWTKKWGAAHATPKISPNVIAPRSIGTVEVHSTPFPVGEKLVSVTLHTDSHLSPTGELRLRVFGWRRPPFMLQSGAELVYRAHSFREETRELTVLNVELSGSKPRQPLIESELPFLQFTTPVIDEQPYSDPTTVQRTYRYKVKFSSPPPANFAGDVVVIDPWDRQHSDRIPVRGEALPPFTVAPSRIILRADSPPHGDDASTRLFVFSQIPAPEISAAADQDATSPLSISRLELDPECLRATFSIGIKPGGRAGR